MRDPPPGAAAFPGSVGTGDPPRDAACRVALAAGWGAIPELVCTSSSAHDTSPRRLHTPWPFPSSTELGGFDPDDTQPFPWRTGCELTFESGSALRPWGHPPRDPLCGSAAERKEVPSVTDSHVTSGRERQRPAGTQVRDTTCLPGCQDQGRQPRAQSGSQRSRDPGEDADSAGEAPPDTDLCAWRGRGEGGLHIPALPPPQGWAPVIHGHQVTDVEGSGQENALKRGGRDHWWAHKSAHRTD